MEDLTTNAINTPRSQNHYYEFAIFGLRPKTVHTVTFAGKDWTFATKQKGKDFGAAMISNADGELKVGMLVQFPFPRDMNFELPRTNTLQFQNEQLAGSSRRAVNTVNNIREIKFESADGKSNGLLMLDVNTLLTAGPVSTLYPII
jgi:hypothetical protein